MRIFFLRPPSSRGEIRYYDSLGFLALYVLYIAVVLVGRAVNQRMRERRRRRALVRQLEEEDDDSDEETFSIFLPPRVSPPAR